MADVSASLLEIGECLQVTITETRNREVALPPDSGLGGGHDLPVDEDVLDVSSVICVDKAAGVVDEPPLIKAASASVI